MIKQNKTLSRYLSHLLILGVIYFVVSVCVTILALRQSDAASIFIPFVLVGSGFAYYITTFRAKGGNVNYYFTPHTLTENEIILSNLIIKYRNTAFMTIGALALTVAEIYMLLNNLDNNKPISFDNFFSACLISILGVAGVCEGIKFMTAWWNIRRNMKKEFRS